MRPEYRAIIDAGLNCMWTVPILAAVTVSLPATPSRQPGATLP